MKGTFDQEFVQMLKHSFRNFIACVVIFALPAAVAWIEGRCEEWKLPAYFHFGARIIAVALFIIDGIVVIATAAILAVKLIKKLWK